jgi:hypothetical protein
VSAFIVTILSILAKIVNKTTNHQLGSLRASRNFSPCDGI